MRLRVLLAALGALAGAYGAFLLLSRQDGDQLVNAATWLAAGVVLHDFVLAPVVLGLVALGARVAPVAARVPLAGALVVLGSVTLLAIPVLGRSGARPDNPTLLDRDYTVGWLALAGVVLLGAVVAGLVRSRRQQGRVQGQQQGR
ncbi:hypothetical protein [Nocardioides sp.]|uniref:hypothetical protein n=1 Tax=Nocardioides sp. TaxID=35761 RepID=UPI001A3013F6|nr:hypothetical protein [Nocardioides sp.]MBJ7357743.1 hypothetical protein [Nocardioides sp.]